MNLNMLHYKFLYMIVHLRKLINRFHKTSEIFHSWLLIIAFQFTMNVEKDIKSRTMQSPAIYLLSERNDAVGKN